ncbi:hypothetical protein MQC88_08255 [Luteimonas sp. 50]|uniref:Tetratricopeptide repeat protein n=1 Tax=Cognatiluteimonas sedimenti TaxID=2927791 RepID=A0ABT0A4N7_9GAMM|nr:hypothetical protein [Lysobacter sedimenti]MCJ0825946.1 hypothetical protein [Lysobacter sedimenti]
MFDMVWSERSAWPQREVGSEDWFSAVTKLTVVPSWLPLYRDSLTVLIARVVTAAGVGPQFVDAIKSDRPTEKLLDLVEQLPDEPPEDLNATAIAFALVGNLDAISHYSRSINDMFLACEKGELEALIQALSIDSHLSAMPFFQAALRLGQLSGDSTAAEEIFKAIRGPHRKRSEYPKLRWVEYLLRDQGAFEACSREEIYQLCVEHLRVYDPSGTKKDPKAALFSRFRTWQKEAGIQNPRFGFSAAGK